MELRSDIPLPEGRRRKGGKAHVFEAAKHGDSVHFEDQSKASSFSASFWVWKQGQKTTLKIVRRSVGIEDPDGPGYRLFFVNEE